VFEGGPADRAGVRPGDLIEAIDGVSTEGLDLRKAVERLRGPEGTEVVVRVLRPGPGDVRTLTMTRGRLPRQTVTGIRRRTDGAWDVRLDVPEPIGFLKIGEISGSTPRELRQMARQLEAEGIRALILDLRMVSQAGFHPTVLLADGLLDGGAIGRVRTAAAVTPYVAEPDALFRDWPLAVLVDGSTSGAAEWLVAALQDNHRAVIVGTRTPGAADVLSTVPLPGGEWSIRMTTGRLERGDGRPLAGPSRASGRRLVAPTRPGSIAKVGGGVIPDLIVEEPATAQERLIRTQRGPRESETKDRAPDPYLMAARRRLVEAMKASGP
jgi:carboxyl-terminal processing protease